MVKNILKKLFQIISLFVLVIAMGIIVVGGMIGVSFVKIAENAPKINPENILMDLSENSKIVDMNGKLIEEVATDEYREIVTYDKIPKYLTQAFVSIEDERFWTNKGIDFKGIAKSIIENISAGRIVRGASTITQQLVKNIYLTNEKSIERKVTEMYLSLQIGQDIPKHKIIEAYMNRVFFGQHAFGVEAAAQTYFSKSVKDLTIAQAATLAGIVQSPDTFSLFKTYYPSSVPKNAKVVGNYYVANTNFVAVLKDNVFKRKDIVLDKMHELGYIDDAQWKEAKAEDVGASVKPGNKRQKDYSNDIQDLIKQQAIQYIMKSQNISREEAGNIYQNGGLVIKTTIDWDVQKKLEDAYKNFSKTFAAYQNGRPLLASMNMDSEGNILSKNGNLIYFKKSVLLDNKNIIKIPKSKITKNKDGSITFNTERVLAVSGGLKVSNYWSTNDENNLVTFRGPSINIDDSLIDAKSSTQYTLKKEFFDENKDFLHDYGSYYGIDPNYYSLEQYGTVQPQSATMIIDQYTGRIVALVGGRDKNKDNNINRAIDFTRSPGSTIKPLATYAPALENGYTLASVIDDAPMVNSSGEIWPNNVTNRFPGLTDLRTGLATSSNVVAVKLLNEIGIDTSKKYLERFGIINDENPDQDNFITAEEDKSTNDENLSLTLGGLTRGFTVKDMASAYIGLANGGSRIDSTIIESIDSKKLGNIYKNEMKETRVISKETAWLITDVLGDIVDMPYMSSSDNSYGIDTVAKSGTSNDKADFWIAGYNPYYTAVSWLGFDNNNISLIEDSGLAARLYGSYMNNILANKEAKSFKMPDTIIKIKVDRQSGDLPSDLTSKDIRGSQIVEEYFDKNHVPTKVSTVHVALVVDVRNGLLASNSTPDYARATKVYTKRSEPYIASEHANKYPEDWAYEAPNKYSTLGDTKAEEEAKKKAEEDAKKKADEKNKNKVKDRQDVEENQSESDDSKKNIKPSSTNPTSTN